MAWRLVSKALWVYLTRFCKLETGTFSLQLWFNPHSKAMTELMAVEGGHIWLTRDLSSTLICSWNFPPDIWVSDVVIPEQIAQTGPFMATSAVPVPNNSPVVKELCSKLLSKVRQLCTCKFPEPNVSNWIKRFPCPSVPDQASVLSLRVIPTV